MSELTIITNNVPRDVIEAYQLTEDERKEFDYIDWNRIDNGENSASFFRYKGELYDLSDCEQTNSIGTPFGKWDGYYSQTFFSGIVFKYAPDTDFEQVIVGRYYS